MIEKQVVVDNLLTHYAVSGHNGPTVLLLHGWGDSFQTYKSLSVCLSDHFKVVVVDLPGFGGTDTPKSTWNLDAYSNFVSRFIDKINIKPYAVIGHSNGGAIAIRGIATDRIEANKLILLSSSGIRDEYKGKKKIYRLAAKTAKVFTAPLPESAKKKIKKKAYDSIGSDMFVAENLQETFKQIIADDVQSDCKKITQSTLLIYGAEDKATPPKHGELLASLIPNSRLEIVGNAGHFVHHDAAKLVEDKIVEFLG